MNLNTVRIDRVCCNRNYITMNRPRNHQPRQNRHNNPRPPRRDPSSNTVSSVPTIQQVIPGASVSIVLKADQRTGKETQGIVKDLLTRGDHPRGIKVRLQDGQIGRVQRLGAGDISATETMKPVSELNHTGRTQTSRPSFRDEVAQAQEPPLRTLADFIPESNHEEESATSTEEQVHFSSATVNCPICGVFEGDETAVAHHIQDHLD